MKPNSAEGLFSRSVCAAEKFGGENNKRGGSKVQKLSDMDEKILRFVDAGFLDDEYGDHDIAWSWYGIITGLREATSGRYSAAIIEEDYVGNISIKYFESEWKAREVWKQITRGNA